MLTHFLTTVTHTWFCHKDVHRTVGANRIKTRRVIGVRFCDEQTKISGTVPVSHWSRNSSVYLTDRGLPFAVFFISATMTATKSIRNRLLVWTGSDTSVFPQGISFAQFDRQYFTCRKSPDILPFSLNSVSRDWLAPYNHTPLTGCSSKRAEILRRQEKHFSTT